MTPNDDEDMDGSTGFPRIKIPSGTNAQDEMFEGDVNPASPIPGVPHQIAQAFLRGLDDVKNGRLVDSEATILEGRRRLAEHRAQK